MPTYEYICDACGKEYEKFQSIMSKPDRVCPSCKARKVRRKIGIGSAVIFKGSGFYETDYRSEGYTKAAEADRKSSQEASGTNAVTGDSKTTAAGPAKSDAKSDAKSGATSGAVGASSDGKSSASTSNSGGESNSSAKRGATSASESGASSQGGNSTAQSAGGNSVGVTTGSNSAANGAKSSSASNESSSSSATRSSASNKQHMVSKAVHPSRVGRGKGNLRRKKK
jgi:putative FmdB family regulatory protein